MLSDRDALLAAIRANPEEDTPRLMFADWLDEHGEPERAEFIRLQCELARLADEGGASHAMYAFLRDHYAIGLAATDWTRIDPGVHRILAMSMRTNDLLKRHGEGWWPKLPKKYKVQWDGFHRGFPHRATLGSMRWLQKLAPHVRSAAPAVTLAADHFNTRIVEQLADVDLLAWCSGLELSGDSWPGVDEFGHYPEAAGVRTLCVNSYAYETAEELVETRYWTGLHELDLHQIPVPARSAAALFGAKHLHSLRRLRLRGDSSWNADTMRALAAGGFTGLTSLDLVYCDLDDDAAEVLANCPHLANLRTLDLTNNRITGRGATALLTSRHLAGVVSLVLNANPCTGLDAKRLAKAEPASLRMLHFHDSWLRTADVRALTRCPRLRTLWYLDLDANNIGTPAVRELVRGFGTWCPPILWLTHNRIDDRGAQLLANWKAAVGLSALYLGHNSAMTDAGVRALLDSPHLINLDALGVHTQDDELNARLRARFRHHDRNDH